MATTRRSKVEIVREYETNPEEDTSSTISQTRMRPRDKVNNNQISIDNVEEVTVEEVQGPNTQTNHNNNLDTQNMRNSVEVDYPDPDAKALVVSTNAERNTGQRPKAEDMNHVRAEQNPERQLVSRKPIRIKIKRDFDRDPGRGVVAIRGSGYNGVQDHMERELERRKMDWEKEVRELSLGYFFAFLGHNIMKIADISLPTSPNSRDQEENTACPLPNLFCVCVSFIHLRYDCVAPLKILFRLSTPLVFIIASRNETAAG